MANKRTLNTFIGKHKKTSRLYFTGFSMGLADLVPGVSGGTIAFLFGIYDELLYSIKLLTGAVPKLVLQKKIKQAITIIPYSFLVPLFLGMISAIFGLVQVFSYLLDSYPVFIWSLFFGLIIGSSYIVAKRITEWNTNRGALLFLGGALTYAVVGLPGLSANTSTVALALTGAIAVSAMVLPGISGSLIMVLLGQYETVLTSVSERNIPQLITFALGALAGLGLFARLLSWLLKEHHSGTIAFLVGVMLGSLRKVWPWKIELQSEFSANTLPELSYSFMFAIICIVFGFLIVWKLEQTGIAKEHVDITDKAFKKELRSQHD